MEGRSGHITKPHCYLVLGSSPNVSSCLCLVFHCFLILFFSWQRRRIEKCQLDYRRHHCQFGERWCIGGSLRCCKQLQRRSADVQGNHCLLYVRISLEFLCLSCLTRHSLFISSWFQSITNTHNYDSFIRAQADKVLGNAALGGGAYGPMWSAKGSGPSASGQGSALGALVGAAWTNC